LLIGRSAASAKRDEPISASSSKAEKPIRLMTIAPLCEAGKVKYYG
jgi:hypothetical protein